MRRSTGLGRRFIRLRRCAVLAVTASLALTAVQTLPAQAAVTWAPALTRAPYLTDLVDLGVEVNWATNRSSAVGSLLWGTVTAGICSLTNSVTAPAPLAITVGTVAEWQWSVPLTLPTQGRYCYQPSLAGSSLLGANPPPQFQTQVAASDTTPYTFDVFGDWGQVDSTGASADQANLFSQIATSGARFALTVGDNGYPNGSQLNYGDLSQIGTDTSAIFGPSFWAAAGSSIPLFPAAGNHGLSGPTHTDQSTWTQPAAVSSSAGRYQDDTYCCVNGSASAHYASSWYAFNAGPARFYVLDSAWGDSNVGTASTYANDLAAHFTPGTPEYTWLVNDLKTHPSALKFAFSHYPFHADNPSQSSDTFLTAPNSLEGLLGQYGVDMVFNGHAHMYQRNTPNGPGMPVTYTTGGGGAALEPIGPCTAIDAYGVGWSPTTSKGTACGTAAVPTSASQVFHFLKVTVAGNSVTVTPTDELGRTFDAQTYTFTNVPDTVIDSAPATTTNSPSATFTFHSTRVDPAVPTFPTFACSLDAAAAAPCTSPATYPGLANGAHTFSVAATTSYGTDPTPANATWSVEQTPPTPPTNVTAVSPAATAVALSWTASTDNVAVAGYDIVRNGSTIGSTTTATSYVDALAQPSTAYQYVIVARDSAGNTAASAPVAVSTGAATGVPTLIQQSGSATTTATLPGPTAPGDLLVLTAGVLTGASKQITGVSDGKNTWTKAGAYTFAGQNSDGEIWYAPNAGSVRSVTVSTTAAVSLSVREFSGVASAAPLVGAAGTAAKSTAADSGTINPTATNDLAIGFVAGHGNVQPISPPAGYTNAQQQVSGTGTSAVTLVSGYTTSTVAGTAQHYTGSFGASMYWSAGAVVFAPAAAAPPSDFSLSATPSTATVTAGQTTTTTLATAITTGTTQNVALTTSALPTGTTATYNPTTIAIGTTATLTLATTTATPPGTYPLTLTATGPTATHTTTYTLTVTAPAASVSLVQATGATETTAATTLAATFAVPAAVGHLLVLSAGVYTGATNHITSVTDTGGNVWHRINAWSTASHNSDGEMWYANVTAATSTVKVQVGLALSIALQLQEFSSGSGSLGLDTSVGASGLGVTAGSGVVLPAVAGELIVGFVSGHANAQLMPITTPGFTTQNQVTSTPSIVSVVTGYRVAPTTASASIDSTYPTSMYWSSGVVAFRVGA